MASSALSVLTTRASSHNKINSRLMRVRHSCNTCAGLITPLAARLKQPGRRGERGCGLDSALLVDVETSKLVGERRMQVQLGRPENSAGDRFQSLGMKSPNQRAFFSSHCGQLVIIVITTHGEHQSLVRVIGVVQVRRGGLANLHIRVLPPQQMPSFRFFRISVLEKTKAYFMCATACQE
jgi:hypothetical protein